MNIVIFVNPLLRNWLGNDWVEGGMGLVSPNIKIFVNLELQGSDKFISTFLHISQVTHITQFIFTSSVLGMRVDGWGERVILLAIRDCCYGLLLNL